MNIDYDGVREYVITLSGGTGGGMPTIRKLAVTSLYADADALASLLCRENNCDATIEQDGECICEYRRCTWAKRGGMDGQAILDHD